MLSSVAPDYKYGWIRYSAFSYQVFAQISDIRLNFRSSNKWDIK